MEVLKKVIKDSSTETAPQILVRNFKESQMWLKTPMLAHKYIEHFNKVKFPCFLQPKLDGIRATFEEGKFISRKKKSFIVNDELLSQTNLLWNELFILCQEEIIPDGEFYIHGLNFDYISGQVRNHQKNKNLTMEFHIFDIALNGLSFFERWKKIQDALNRLSFSSTNLIKLVPVVEVQTHEEIEQWLDNFTGKGYEGVMIRNNTFYQAKRTYDLLKYKNYKKVVGIIVDFEEGQGRLEESCGALIVKLENGSFPPASIGSGLDDSLRQALWVNKEWYRGKKIEIEYQEESSKGTLRFGRFKNFVEEEKEEEKEKEKNNV